MGRSQLDLHRVKKKSSASCFLDHFLTDFREVKKGRGQLHVF
jgi:hypothetical protein